MDDFYRGDSLCPTCIDQYIDDGIPIDGRGSPIRYYSYTPDELLVRRYGSKAGIELMVLNSYRGLALQRVEHYYGIELEVEPEQPDPVNVMDAARYVNERGEGFFYCKKDASVARGFEIVTHPATLEWWMRHGQRLLSEVSNQLTSHYGMTSHRFGRCGLHIHTNKAALSHIQCKRMVEFMYDKRRRNWIEKLSRRGGPDEMDYASLTFRDVEWNTRTGTYDLRPLGKAAILLAKNGKRGGDRSQALNMSNDSTAELRLFRGTLNTDHVLGGIQFYEALIQLCDPKVLPGMHAPTLKQMKRYIGDHPKKYTELQQMLEVHGLCA
jgi:hypothetical protein